MKAYKYRKICGYCKFKDRKYKSGLIKARHKFDCPYNPLNLKNKNKEV